ncbi:MAG: lysylphosphatidylglycerol synthase transmembrane domain-containing protein [Peptoanaerobacter stomatis]
MNNKIIKNVPRNIIIMALLIFITFKYLITGFTSKDIFKAIKNADGKLLVFSIVLSIIYILCEAFNTKNMLQSYGYKTDIFRTAMYAFSGYFFSGLTPSATGGQPMQVLIMKKDNIKISHSSLILMIELCVYQFVTVIMAVIGFYYNYDYIFSKKGLNVWIIYLGIFINLLIFLFIVFAIFSERFIKFIRRIAFFAINKLPLSEKDDKKNIINKGLDDYRNSSIFIKKNKKLVFIILLTTTIQVTVLYTISYIVYRSLGFNNFAYYRIIFLQALAYVSVSSLPLPGAIGVSEKLFQFLFLSVYSKDVITDALVLTRGANFYVLFAISALIFFVSFGEYIFKQKKEEVKNV